MPLPENWEQREALQLMQHCGFYPICWTERPNSNSGPLQSLKFNLVHTGRLFPESVLPNLSNRARRPLRGQLRRRQRTQAHMARTAGTISKAIGGGVLPTAKFRNFLLRGSDRRMDGRHD